MHEHTGQELARMRQELARMQGELAKTQRKLHALARFAEFVVDADAAQMRGTVEEVLEALEARELVPAEVVEPLQRARDERDQARAEAAFSAVNLAQAEALLACERQHVANLAMGIEVVRPVLRETHPELEALLAGLVEDEAITPETAAEALA